MEMSKEDREYSPNSFDLQCMAEAEWLENLHKPKPYEKKKPPKKKSRSKGKQPTMKQVVKKMNQPEFPGILLCQVSASPWPLRPHCVHPYRLREQDKEEAQWCPKSA